MNARGYADYSERMPPGWHLAPTDRWPINNPESGRPRDFKIEKWRLRTRGAVENPLELSVEEFHDLPHVTRVLDHHCIDGWSYLGQTWDGVDISVIKEM